MRWGIRTRDRHSLISPSPPHAFPCACFVVSLGVSGLVLDDCWLILLTAVSHWLSRARSFLSPSPLPTFVFCLPLDKSHTYTRLLLSGNLLCVEFPHEKPCPTLLSSSSSLHTAPYACWVCCLATPWWSWRVWTVSTIHQQWSFAFKKKES